MRVRRSPSFMAPRPLPYEVDRSHLLSSFDGKHLLLVAPSGYGKSTLAAQWARAAGQHTIWYNFILSDQDPDLFAAWLHRGAAQNLMLDTAPEEDASAEKTILQLVETLNNLPFNVRLVFDNVHILSSNLLKWIHLYTSLLGEGHQVCFCTYHTAKLDLKAMEMEGILLLNEHQLTFKRDEVLEIARQLGQLEAGAQTWEMTEGWPTAVLLDLNARQTGHQPHTLILHMLNRLPDEVMHTLLHLCHEETWHVDLVHQLQVPYAEHWLDLTLESGLPGVSLHEGLYRPHQLVRDVLQDQLKQHASLYQQVHLKSADLHVKQGHIEKAIFHLKAAGDFAHAVDLITTLVTEFLRKGETHYLGSLLEGIPPAQMNEVTRAALGFWHLEVGKLQEAREIFHDLTRREEPVGLGFLGLSNMAYREYDLTTAYQLCQQAVPLLDHPLQQKATEAWMWLIGCYAGLVTDEEAHTHLLDIYRYSKIQGDLVLQIRVLPMVTNTMTITSDELLQEQLQLLEQAFEAGFTVLALNLINQVTHHLLDHLFDSHQHQVRKILERTWSVIRPLNLRYLSADLCFMWADLEFKSGQWEGVHAWIQEGLRLAGETGTLMKRMDLLRLKMETLMFQHDLTEIAVWLQEEPLVEQHFPYFREALQFMQGQAVHENIQVKYQEVLAGDFSSLQINANQHERVQMNLMLLHEVSHQHFAGAPGLYHDVIGTPECRSWTDPVHQLLFDFHQSNSAAPTTSRKKVITFHTSGKLQVLLDGQEVRLNYITQGLVLYLLARHTVLDKHALSEALWDNPDASNTLKATIRHIRVLFQPLLSGEIIKTTPQGYTFNPEHQHVIDHLELRQQETLTLAEAQERYPAPFVPEWLSLAAEEERGSIYQFLLKSLHPTAKTIAEKLETAMYLSRHNPLDPQHYDFILQHGSPVQKQKAHLALQDLEQGRLPAVFGHGSS